MPALVDTTIRLLGQEPLAGVMPTAEQLPLAEILDSAGFAYLEVSGGGCFDSAVAAFLLRTRADDTCGRELRSFLLAHSVVFYPLS